MRHDLMIDKIKGSIFGKEHTFYLKGVGEFKTRFKDNSKEVLWECKYSFPGSNYPTYLTILGDRMGPFKDKVNLILPFIHQKKKIDSLIDIKLRSSPLSNMKFEQLWKSCQNRFRIVTIESFFEDKNLVELWIRSSTDDTDLYLDFIHGTIRKFDISTP